MNRLFLLLILFPLQVFSQTNSAQLFIIQDSWTDTTIQHSIYGFLNQEASQKDTADLFFFSSGKVVDKKILTIQQVGLSLINFKSVQKNQVHIDSCRIFLRSGRKINYKVMQYLLTIRDKVKYSPLITFIQKNGGQGGSFKMPANNFNPDTDSLSFSVTTQFSPGNSQSKFGYQFMMLTSNQDTLVRFYQKIADSTQRMNSVTLSLNKIPSGKYDLVIEFLVNNRRVGMVQGGPVFILAGNANRGLKPNHGKPEKTLSFFDEYSESEIDEFMEKSRFIATNEELSLFGNLKNVTQKRLFLKSFWEKRQNDQENNLFRYLEKLSLVEGKYGISGRKGYKTDRGRIFLKYGLCDDIYVSNSTTTVKPFEVWFYPNLNGQSSVYFYFVDQKGYGDLQLIHSTARDEVYNPALLDRLGIDAINYRN